MFLKLHHVLVWWEVGVGFGGVDEKCLYRKKTIEKFPEFLFAVKF